MARATAKREVPMTHWGEKIMSLAKFVDGYARRPDLAPGTARICERDDGSTLFEWVCPCGCGAVHFINLNPAKAGHGWQWDGDREKPTLKPSLGMHPKDGSARDGSGYHWHGHLKNGVFEEC